MEFFRTPHKEWYNLSENPGWLTIKARSATLGDINEQPSFTGRRQQHANATVRTAMSYMPTHNGDKAGLAVFQNEDYFYLMSITRKDGKSLIQLEKKEGPQTNSKILILQSKEIKISKGSVIYLKIAAQSDRYSFYYKCKSARNWKLLESNVDGTVLSTKVAGGFVGPYFGFYAHSSDN